MKISTLALTLCNMLNELYQLINMHSDLTGDQTEFNCQVGILSGM